MAGLVWWCCCVLFCGFDPFWLSCSPLCLQVLSHQAPEMNSSLLQPCRQGEGLSFWMEKIQKGAGRTVFQTLKNKSSSAKWKQGFQPRVAAALCNVSLSKCWEIWGCTGNSQDKLLALMLHFHVTSISFPTTKLFLIIKIILQNSPETEAHFSWSQTFFFAASNPLFCMFGLSSNV